MSLRRRTFCASNRIRGPEGGSVVESSRAENSTSPSDAANRQMGTGCATPTFCMACSQHRSVRVTLAGYSSSITPHQQYRRKGDQ